MTKPKVTKNDCRAWLLWKRKQYDTGDERLEKIEQILNLMNEL